MIYKKYCKEDRERVIKLFEDGKNKCEISKITNIPRSTLKKWIQAFQNGKLETIKKYDPIVDINEYLKTECIRKAYSFTLGIYLCDGYISSHKSFRAPSIRFFNDSKYPKNTQEWAYNLQIILPENSVNVIKRKNANVYNVLSYSKKLITLFPQHGKGKKHDRKLNFTDWQLKIVKEYPEEFIRACIQSDGCIYAHKQSKYNYMKYAFVNKSEDIIDLFLYALKEIKITKNKYYNPSKKCYVIQNFSKNDLETLNKIIKTKE